MKNMGYLTIGLLSWIAACGGGTATATAPAGDSTVPDSSEAAVAESEEVVGVTMGHTGEYHLYVLPIPHGGPHEPALPGEWADSQTMFDAAVELYDDKRFIEAAAGFLSAADTISAIDPYYAETFDKIRGLMCGNAHWAFVSADAAEQIEPAAAQREASDPVCASTLRSGHQAPDAPTD